MPDPDQERAAAWQRLNEAWKRMKGPHATLAEELADIHAWEQAYWTWMGLQHTSGPSPWDPEPPLQTARARRTRLPARADNQAYE